MSHEVSLAPSQIRFMHDTIQPQFRCGRGLNVTIDDICHGHKDLNQIPMIEVTKRNNKYYSLNNRRLYLFRVLQKRGRLSRIDVRLVSRWDERKFTTKNDGASVRLRRDQTYPHSFDKKTIAHVNVAQISRPADKYKRTLSVRDQPRKDFVEQKRRPTTNFDHVSLNISNSENNKPQTSTWDEHKFTTHDDGDSVSELGDQTYPRTIDEETIALRVNSPQINRPTNDHKRILSALDRPRKDFVKQKRRPTTNFDHDILNISNSENNKSRSSTWDEHKFTTHDDGDSVRELGDQTYPRTIDEETIALRVNSPQINRPADEYKRTPSVLDRPRKNSVEKKRRPTTKFDHVFLNISNNDNDTPRSSSIDELEEKSFCERMCSCTIL